MGFAIFFAMYLGGILFSTIMARRRGEPLDEVAFGYGDVMLATLSGFMLGWQALIFAIFIAVFAGAAGLFFFLFRRTVFQSKDQPFFPPPFCQYNLFLTLFLMLLRGPRLHYPQ